METTTIHDKQVLAKQTPYGLRPKTFSNRTQALKAIEKLGMLNLYVWHPGRPFYVVIEQPSTNWSFE